MHKGALVLEGGSLRAMFTAGVLDVLMDGHIWFEYANGVSAGSLCGYGYVARQSGRSRQINETFCGDRRFLGLSNLLRSGGVFNFDFLFGDVCDALYPLDRETFSRSPQKFEAVATDCLTGKPAFFEKGDYSPEEFLTACRASSSMPGLSEIVRLRDVPYLDGGCSCPIAFQRAIDLGYEKVVVVLTRPYGYRKKPYNRPVMDRSFDRLYSRYPALCASLHEMPRRYNRMLGELEALEREGRVFILRPDKPVVVGRLERDAQKLEDLYQDGRRVMLEHLDELMLYLDT
jgi:Predicted esterase of the alpha-beta hydrolase superfamily